jgi:Ca-activated chloride channel homolog
MLRVLCTMLFAAVLAAAQVGEEQTITVNVDLVNIYFTVCNHKGRLIADLARDRFAITEDGTPQVITNFSRETDAALTMVLLIDTSGSVYDKLRYEQLAATQFLYDTLRPGRDKAALVTFDHFFVVQQDYTSDPTVLATAVRRLRSGGGTRLYDALHFVMQEKLMGTEERKVIILITDGDDKSSRRSPQEVVDLAQRSNVSIYAVSINGLGVQRGESVRSDRVLEMLTSETGGKAFFPSRLDKVVSDFKQIDNELRSQYTIAYRSSNPARDGSFRKVRIEVKRGNLSYSVRARSGYYAPVQTMAQRN